ncbi:hypothetical protein [Paraburkholderia sp. GAS32]|uniref:hypothetical protein n=1 Tax=Paraburkholderia sp. GAS32 TaxID=3035129 RepID=UPI003D1A2BB3
MGLHIDVFRASQGGSHIDCTMDGISSKADQLCIVNVPGPFNPSDTIPAAMLVKGNALGTVQIVPAVKPGNEWIETRRNACMGGNYGASSDSRFNEAVEKLIGGTFYGAVAIHDRFE